MTALTMNNFEMKIPSFGKNVDIYSEKKTLHLPSFPSLTANNVAVATSSKIPESKLDETPEIITSTTVLNSIQRKGFNPIILRRHQIEHSMNMYRHLYNNLSVLDFSIMGSGKTFTATSVALRHCFPYVLVLCPAGLMSIWKNAHTMYGLPAVDEDGKSLVFSYQSFRSIRQKTPKHGFISRYDSTNEKGGNETTFIATQKLRELIKRGVLIIFDEFQSIKNGSTTQRKACQTLTSEVINMGGRSRIIMLSGTAVETADQVLDLMYLLGIMRHRNISVFKKDTSELKLYAAQELKNFCMKLDPEETTQLLENEPFNPTNCKNVCYNLFMGVIVKHMSFTMTPPDLGKAELDCGNAFYTIESKDAKELENAIISLNTATRYNKKTNEVDYGSHPNWKSITNALRKIEIAKVKTFIRIARQTLETVPHSKVAIFLSYLIPIKSVIDELSKDYGVVKLTGSVKPEKRPELIAAFQEDSDRVRVIVANITIASQGISLDDTLGTRPRFAFITPTYRIQHQQQAPYRFYRTDTKSTATIRIVYCECADNLHVTENSIILALARKSKVMKDILAAQVKSGVIFPSDYKAYYENNAKHMEVVEEITTTTVIKRTSKNPISNIPRNFISVRNSNGRIQRNIVLMPTLINDE